VLTPRQSWNSRRFLAQNCRKIPFVGFTCPSRQAMTAAVPWQEQNRLKQDQAHVCASKTLALWESRSNTSAVDAQTVDNASPRRGHVWGLMQPL